MTSGTAAFPAYEFGDFRLEPARRRLLHYSGGAVELTGKPFDALVFLVERAGVPVTRGDLLEALWPRTIVEDNSLNKLIAALRRALGDDGHRYIVTLPGRGYQFVADVRKTEPQAPTKAEPLQPLTAVPGTASLSVRRAGRRSVATVVLLGVLCSAALLFAWAKLDSWYAVPDTAAADAALGAVVRVSPLTAYAGTELSPSLSPDGQSIAFSWDGEGGNRDIYVARIGGSGALRLTEAPEPDRDPVWSPDGSQIAFLRQIGPYSFDLMLVSPVGAGTRRIRTVFMRPADVWGSPLLAWTPSSDGLVFTTRSSDDATSAHHLYALTLSSGDTVQLTDGDDVYDTAPALSSDGRWLAFVRHSGWLVHVRGVLQVQSFKAALEGARDTILVPVPEAGEELPCDSIYSPSWSARGRYLAFVAGADLIEWEYGATASTRVYPGRAILGRCTASGELSAISIVRDGASARAVVASVNGGSDIFAQRLSQDTHAAVGTSVRRFYSSAGEIQPHFSPDGQRVAFVSARDGNSDVWVAAANDGSPTRLTDMRVPTVGTPRWSRDGKQLAFFARAAQGAESQVYVLDPDGGVPRHLGAGWGPEWSADGEYLYVSDLGPPWLVRRIRVADAQSEALFTGGFVALTADGSRLLYAKWNDDTNLYARDLAGDPRSNPEEVLTTDFGVPGGITTTTDGFFYLSYGPPDGQPRAIRFFDYATRLPRDVMLIPRNIGNTLTLSRDATELLYSAQDNESGADLVLLEFAAPSR
jgi:Tol biopolymer transport system component/DNA-binding winged helix-turn-helix (wHTH) protein